MDKQNFHFLNSIPGISFLGLYTELLKNKTFVLSILRGL